MRGELPGLRELLESQPGLRARGSSEGETIIEGLFSFKASNKLHGEIEGAFEIKIRIPKKFPNELPVATETGGKIPRSNDFHVNSSGTLCLASPIRILIFSKAKPNLKDYISELLVPYLYAISLKLRGLDEMPFGELGHGKNGLFQDYKALFDVESDEAVLRFLDCLCVRKRLANRLPCPCGCGRRLGECRTRKRLNGYRKILPGLKILRTEKQRLDPSNQTGELPTEIAHRWN